MIIFLKNPLDVNSEIWVETKTQEGKSYYYNARSRETTWTKPEGPAIKVISQDQVEAMAQAVQSTGAPGGQQQQIRHPGEGGDEQEDQSGVSVPGAGPGPGPGGDHIRQSPGQGGPNMHGPPPGLMQVCF